ncbi:CatB-related O-acetyltransferase [Desulfopila sp. IMCC35006]|uniref:CatB-related O-acetyltransferase n=1 Tax=Desulfopila sp. IMCC35006 TaxID=2569542 RepID=UPI00197B0129
MFNSLFWRTIRNRFISQKNRYLASNPKFSKFDIGEWTYGTPNVFLGRTHGKLRIGKYCSIGPNVEIVLVGDHRTDFVTTYPFSVFFEECNHLTGFPRHRGDVVIGNDVWLCYGARILSGATIGDGAVIGMDAVVTKDIPSYAIVIGNPAKIIRYRFKPEIIEKLLSIKWWDWPHENVLKAAPYLAHEDIDNFIKFASSNVDDLRSVREVFNNKKQ